MSFLSEKKRFNLVSIIGEFGIRTERNELRENGRTAERFRTAFEISDNSHECILLGVVSELVIMKNLKIMTTQNSGTEKTNVCRHVTVFRVLHEETLTRL